MAAAAHARDGERHVSRAPQESRPVEPTVVARVEPPIHNDCALAGGPCPGLRSATHEVDPFAAMSEQHFERSKLVILGLASRDPHNSSSSDWAYQRQLAGRCSTIRGCTNRSAEARGLESLAGVMSDLELVLLQTSFSDQLIPRHWIGFSV